MWRASAKQVVSDTGSSQKRSRTEPGQGHKPGDGATSGTKGEASGAAGLRGQAKAATRAKRTIEKRLEILEANLQLNSKATLATIDAVREIQGAMNYWWCYAPEDNEIFQAHFLEGAAYRKEKERMVKEAQEKGEQPDLQSMGPASASQFGSAVEILAKQSIKEGITGHDHWKRVKALDELLKSQMDHRKAQHLAGTWLAQNAHKGTKKLVINTNLAGQDADAVNFMLEQVGFTVHVGKPPRNGLAKALQRTLPDKED